MSFICESCQLDINSLLTSQHLPVICYYYVKANAIYQLSTAQRQGLFDIFLKICVLKQKHMLPISCLFLSHFHFTHDTS